MKAKFDGSYVTAPKEAKVFYEQSGYGRIEKDGTLRLAPVEALYLIARGKIEIESLNFDKLLAFCSMTPGFLRSFIVYRDIRERGYVVTTGPHDYRVFPRGQRPGHGQSRFLIRVYSERDIIELPQVLSEAETAANMRKQFVLAVSDDEDELTYYEIRIHKLESSPEKPLDLPNGIHARFAGVSAYVTEDGSKITETLKENWLGTLLDGKRLFLSPVETVWMLEKNLLTSDTNLSVEEYITLAESLDSEFSEKMIVYRYLRDIGFSPRTGYKYGHHFRVYTEDGKHSEMLIQACPMDLKQSMSSVSRSVRLAHSVKKRMLFACIKEEDVTFIEFARMKL